MNPVKIRKLEALLERVQRNSKSPRRRTVNGAGTNGSELLQASQTFVQRTSEAPSSEARPLEEELSLDVEELDAVELDAVELDAVELDATEEAPSSGRVPASMNEALAGAADQLDAEPKTIPPESGPEPLQRKDAGLTQSTPSPAGARPTTEQLGQTVSLEEGSQDSLELDEPLSDAGAASNLERSALEADLPSGAGAYSRDLASPPEAREELERVRLGEVRAEVVARPVISTNVIEFIQAQERPAPKSFAEWLDDTLSLGRN